MKIKSSYLGLKNHGGCCCLLCMEIFMGCHAMEMSSNPYDHQEGEKVPIPTECPEDTHPLKVFEETHVETNVCRWVVFVLWLKQHPNALRWYRIIQRRTLIVYLPFKPCGITVGRYGT